LSFALLAPIVAALLVSAAGVVGMRLLLFHHSAAETRLGEIRILVERFHGEAESINASLHGLWLTNDERFLTSLRASQERIRRLGPELAAKLAQSPLAGLNVQLEKVIRTGRHFIQACEAELALRNSRSRTAVEMNRHVAVVEHEIRPLEEAAQAELDKLASLIAHYHEQGRARSARLIALSSAGILGLVTLALLALGLLALRACRTYVALNAELRARGESLARTSDELRRSNEALDQFNAVATHDLKEPLRMIVSYLRLLEGRLQGRLEESEREFMGYALEGARRLDRLLLSMLEFSRATARPAVPQSVSANEPLEQAVANLHMAISESGARIERERLPEVVADPQQLTQVFQNLIANAIKYRGESPPRVRVTAKPAGDRWEISVRDNGLGFEMSQAERIFHLFHRLGQNDAPGSGIGLSVCRRIVERLGGRLWAESEPGNGAVFRLTLLRPAYLPCTEDGRADNSSAAARR
jgi:signal transduction histidine kinase